MTPIPSTPSPTPPRAAQSRSSPRAQDRARGCRREAGDRARVLAAGLLAVLVAARAAGVAAQPDPAASAPPDAPAPVATLRIDPNTADAAELRLLPGIGPVLARKIVAHRDAHGRFHRPDQLTDVSGVGRITLERIRPWLRIDTAP